MNGSETSDETYMLDNHYMSSDEETNSHLRALEGKREAMLRDGRVSAVNSDVIMSNERLPSIRRVGSRQVLVFYTDGNPIGKLDFF